MNARATKEVGKKSALAFPLRSLTSLHRGLNPNGVSGVQQTHEELRRGASSTTSFGMDFSRIPARSLNSPEDTSPSRTTMEACPLALTSPRACPFGGACHTCPARVQTKLIVNRPGDIHEQEADKVAEDVMRMTESHPDKEALVSSKPDERFIQRKCAKCEHEDEMLQKKELLIRTAAMMDDPSTVPSIVHKVLRSPGQPLDVATRTFFEPRFGHDFSHVRIHTDTKAAASARSVNALAYTVGRDVILADGEYPPRTPDRLGLLAHELTHVVQQGGTHTTMQGRYLVGLESDGYEREADKVAVELVKGNSAPPVAKLSSPMMQRAVICSKRLEAPVVGLFANHSYIDDTGRNDCMGSGMVGNYAVQRLVSGNFIRGCAAKTDASTDPGKYTPNKKPCNPKPSVSDLSACLRAAYSSYADPSTYSNAALAAGAAGGAVVGGVGGAVLGSRFGGVIGAVLGGAAGAFGGAYAGARLASGVAGPNSNTFAATLAKACCADSSSSGLGWVPGWDHAPATPCSGSSRSSVEVA